MIGRWLLGGLTLLGVALAFPVAALARGGGVGGGRRGRFPGEALQRLGFSASQIQVAAWAWDEACALSPVPDEPLILLAIAARETGFRPDVRSAAGLRDDEFGGSFTMYQIGAPSLRSRPGGLDAVSVAGPDDVERAVREQTRAALDFIKANNLRARAERDGKGSAEPGAYACGEYATVWGFGGSKSLAWVLEQPRSVRAGGRLPSQRDAQIIMTTWDQQKAAGVPEEQRIIGTGLAGILHKVQVYRALVSGAEGIA